MTQPYSLYIHVPFCRHRCAYCDFNTYAGQEDSLPAYVGALCREIAFTGQNAPEKISLHTVFFGGGTPSLLTPRQFESILVPSLSTSNSPTRKSPSKPIPAQCHFPICETCARWASTALASAFSRPIPSNCACWSVRILISMSSTL